MQTGVIVHRLCLRSLSSKLISLQTTNTMATPRRSARLQAATDSSSMKVAQEVAHEAEEALGVGHLDPIVGDETPFDLQKVGEDQAASVWVFAFGSNMKKDVLQGRRMIKPAESVPCVAPEYILTFNQPGVPYREPGFATIEKITSDNERAVHGVAHRMTPAEWEYYKESEGAAGREDSGYGIIDVDLEAYDGRKIKAYSLQTQPKSIATLRGRKALPSLRYLNLLRTGAAEHSLDEGYQQYLHGLQHYEPHGLGGKIGGLIMAVIAYALLFPGFIFMRMYRKIRGLHSINPNSIMSIVFAKYFKFVFGSTWVIHEIVRPVLGCGATAKPVAVVVENGTQPLKKRN